MCLARGASPRVAEMRIVVPGGCLARITPPAIPAHQSITVSRRRLFSFLAVGASPRPRSPRDTPVLWHPVTHRTHAEGKWLCALGPPAQTEPPGALGWRKGRAPLFSLDPRAAPVPRHRRPVQASWPSGLPFLPTPRPIRGYKTSTPCPRRAFSQPLRSVEKGFDQNLDQVVASF
jgi:hypothetical protein